MARKDIGKKPEELDMLLSPSRGLQGDEDEVTSLRNPDVQARFRQHIDEKLRRWATAFPPSSTTTAEQRRRRDEELGIILLDLRKLREGITSIRRIDAFACEVYEASALLSLFASNNPQLSSSLPHLVHDLHPALSATSPVPSTDTLVDSFTSLSLASRPPPDAATRAFFLALHLLHSHLLPAFTSSSLSSPAPSTPSTLSSSSPPLSTFLPTLLALLSSSHLPPPSPLSPPTARTHHNPHITLLLRLYTSLLHSSHVFLSRLLSALPPPPPGVAAHLKALHLPPSFDPLAALLRSHTAALRERRIWPVLEKAYRLPPMAGADKVGEWVGRGLLFELDARLDGVCADERSNGKKEPVGESWEDEPDEGEGQRRAIAAEAVKRAEEFVAAKKTGGRA
ncbi:hypothetical protein JCM6882_006177 [Rhodosporidiobolus microsporus]